MKIAKIIAKYNKKSTPECMNLTKVEKSANLKTPIPIGLFQTKQKAFKSPTFSYAWMALDMIYFALNVDELRI